MAFKQLVIFSVYIPIFENFSLLHRIDIFNLISFTNSYSSSRYSAKCWWSIKRIHEFGIYPDLYHTSEDENTESCSNFHKGTVSNYYLVFLFSITDVMLHQKLLVFINKSLNSKSFDGKNFRVRYIIGA